MTGSYISGCRPSWVHLVAAQREEGPGAPSGLEKVRPALGICTEWAWPGGRGRQRVPAAQSRAAPCWGWGRRSTALHLHATRQGGTLSQGSPQGLWEHGGGDGAVTRRGGPGQGFPSLSRNLLEQGHVGRKLACSKQREQCLQKWAKDKVIRRPAEAISWVCGACNGSKTGESKARIRWGPGPCGGD